MRQLTGGPHNDIEPTYLPDGGILFCSDRCNRWVNCWLTKVVVMYRCDADGRNIRQLSSNSEQENTPWLLPDGQTTVVFANTEDGGFPIRKAGHPSNSNRAIHTYHSFRTQVLCIST